MILMMSKIWLNWWSNKTKTNFVCLRSDDVKSVSPFSMHNNKFSKLIQNFSLDFNDANFLS